MLKNAGGSWLPWLVPAGFVAICVIVWLSVAEPIIGMSLFGAVIATWLVFALPKDRVVGVVGSLCLLLVIVFPVHLVPNTLRLVEVGATAALSLLALARRGFSKGNRGIPLLFLAYLALTMAGTQVGDVQDAMPQFFYHAAIGLGFLIFGCLSSKRERGMMARMFVILAAAQAAYAVVEVAAKPPVLWASPVPENFIWSESRLPSELIAGMVRGQGSFGHPLLLAFVLVVAAGLVLRQKVTLLRFLTVGVLFAGVLATGSRSASLIMAAMILFAFGARKLAVVRGVLLAGAGFLLASGTGMLGAVVERFSESGSLTHRQGAIDALPRLISEQTPSALAFGNGWFSREALYDRGLLQLDGFVAIDNQFVSLLVTAGWVGLALFILLMLGAIRHAGSEYRIALLAAFTMFAVFDVNEFPATWALLSLFIGFAAANRPAEEAVEVPVDAAPKVKRERLPEWATPERRTQLANSAPQQTP
jgi:hypothetical protein